MRRYRNSRTFQPTLVMCKGGQMRVPAERRSDSAVMCTGTELRLHVHMKKDTA